MDNANTAAPVIPAGTNSMQNAVYNPLIASQQAQQNQLGQVANAPVTGNAASQFSQPTVTESPTGQDFAELAALKGFKSADDLARAYKELEKQNKKVEMSVAELIKLRSQSSLPEIIPDVPITKVENQDDAIRIVENIVRKHTRPLEDQLALQQLFMKNTDAPQYAEQMGKIVKDNPGVSWEVAYKAAKFDNLGPQAKEEGRQEAYQTQALKQAATVAPARPTIKESKPLEELILDKNIPFKEVQRIMRERFSQ